MNYKLGDVVVLFLADYTRGRMHRGWDGLKARIVNGLDDCYGPTLEPLEPRPDANEYIQPYSKFCWDWDYLVLDHHRTLSVRQRVAVRELEAENARLRAAFNRQWPAFTEAVSGDPDE